MSRKPDNAKLSGWFDRAREATTVTPSDALGDVRKGYVVCKRCQAQVYQAQEVAGMCRSCAVKGIDEWERIGDLLVGNARIADALGPILMRKMRTMLGREEASE